MATTIGIDVAPRRGPDTICGIDSRDGERLVLVSRRGGCATIFGIVLLLIAATMEIAIFRRPPGVALAVVGAVAGVAGAMFLSRRLVVLDRGRRRVALGRQLVAPHVTSVRALDAGSVVIRETVEAHRHDDTSWEETVFDVLLAASSGEPVKVVRARRWERVRPLAEAVSAFLDLPLVDEVSGLTIAPENLDVSLADRVRREGWRKKGAGPEGATAIVSETMDRAIEIRVPSPRGQDTLITAGVVFLVWTLPVGLTGNLLFGLLPLVMIFAFWIKVRFGMGSVVRVNPEEVEVESYGLFIIRTTKIAADEIEDLLIRRPEKGRASLDWVGDELMVLRSDRTSARFGIGLSRAELEWLREEILAVISTGDSSHAAGKLSPLDEIPTMARGVRIWPWFGLVIGMAVAAFGRGRASVSLAVPFLEEVISVSSLVGLGCGLLVERARHRARSYDGMSLALIAAGLFFLLFFAGHNPLVQPYPTYDERAVAGLPKIGRVVWLGWLPVVTAANVLVAVVLMAAFSLPLRWLRAIGKPSAVARPARVAGPRKRWLTKRLPRYLFGVPFTAAGLIVAGFSVLRGHGPSAFGGLLFSLLFLVPGLWVMEAWRWLPRRWRDLNVDWSTFGGGAIAMAVGMVIIGMAFVTPDEAFGAPRAVAGAAGAAFFFAGLAIVPDTLPLSEATRNLIRRIGATLLLGSFGMVAVWATVGASAVFALGAIVLVVMAVASGKDLWGELVRRFRRGRGE